MSPKKSSEKRKARKKQCVACSCGYEMKHCVAWQEDDARPTGSVVTLARFGAGSLPLEVESGLDIARILRKSCEEMYRNSQKSDDAFK